MTQVSLTLLPRETKTYLFNTYLLDQEYRQGIRILEFLRKKQAETAVHAMRVKLISYCISFIEKLIIVI